MKISGSTDLGVTPDNVDKKTKIGGCFFHIPYTVISNICLHHLGDYRKRVSVFVISIQCHSCVLMA